MGILCLRAGGPSSYLSEEYSGLGVSRLLRHPGAVGGLLGSWARKLFHLLMGLTLARALHWAVLISINFSSFLIVGILVQPGSARRAGGPGFIAHSGNESG